ncbi:MAG: 6-bladed beta-propeller [Gemmatimonadota bacterium]|nr:6-bladed beta-propeller [Gemmatimonadota bacterium]
MATETAPTPVGARACAGTTAFAAALSLTALACEADAPAAGNQADVVIDTIGDTVLVRTLAGSVWGADAHLEPEVSIGELEGPEEYLFGWVSAIAVDDDHNVYVLDWQAQEILEYDVLGNYVRTVARPGEGPGELTRADRMALLPDGRLVVPDAMNGRAQLLGPGPGEREEWPLHDFHPYGTHRIWTDDDGRTWILHLAMPATDWDAMLRGVVIVRGPDGTHLDTLPGPAGDFDPPELTASSKPRGPTGATGHRTEPVPFSPAAVWAGHPHGGILKGVSSDYRIDLHLGDRVLRIERAFDPIPVPPAERDHYRDSITDMMRYMDPDWEWNGPPIPETKPVFRRLHSGRDGRIWVELSPALRSDDDPSLGERIRYDVFEPDGAYLGAVDAPVEFKASVNPVFDGDHVWAVTRDELDVQRVVRYRIVR